MLFFLRSFRDNQIRVQHSFLNCFFAGSDLALEVFLHNQSSDRYCILGTESSVFNIDSDHNFRVVFRSEGHENGVLLSMRILSCPGFTAYDYRIDRSPAGRSAAGCHRHTFYDDIEVFPVTVDRMFLDLIVRPFDRTYDMRSHIIPPVSQYTGHIGYLQRSKLQLSLSDRKRHNITPAPILSPEFAIE